MPKPEIIRSERALGGVEAVDDDCIEAEIDGKDETIVGRRLPIQCACGPSWRSLLGPVPECLTKPLVLPSLPSERTGKRRCCRSVVRDEQKLPVLSKRKVARVCAASGKLIQKRERAGFGVDGKGADAPLFLEIADFIRGVEHICRWDERQRRKGSVVSAATPLGMSMPVRGIKIGMRKCLCWRFCWCRCRRARGDGPCAAGFRAAARKRERREGQKKQGMANRRRVIFMRGSVTRFESGSCCGRKHSTQRKHA